MQSQSTELLDDCQKLLDRFKYPWEMMPLMYVILKDAQADIEEASRRIDEGRSTELLSDLCHRLNERYQWTWKMIPLVYVILKNHNEDFNESTRRIDEAVQEIRAWAAVETAKYAYHHTMPYNFNWYSGIYSSMAYHIPSLYHSGTGTHNNSIVPSVSPVALRTHQNTRPA
ncbi:doublesex [Carabus blaptoides fortunei]